MVAFTPNRGYPYSQGSDPADAAGAIQALAEAIDVDMQNLDDSIIRRPFAAVRSVSAEKQVFPSETLTEATYDFVEADTAGISNLTNFPTRLTPTSAGFWLVWGAIEVPLAQSRTKDVFLRKNGVDITRYEQHINDPTGTGGQMMTLAAMAFMNGTTDYFTMTFEPDQASSDYKIGNKRLAAFRLTNS
jgi:hypothetical protein